MLMDGELACGAWNISETMPQWW